MKKFSFTLIAALGVMVLFSCGPKMDTPENVGNSVLDEEKVGKLYITKEEMTEAKTEAGKTQMDSTDKAYYQSVKADFVDSFDLTMSISKMESYKDTNEEAKVENINWENVEFVLVESKEETTIGLKELSELSYLKGAMAPFFISNYF